jgi:hypothetical protein
MKPITSKDAKLGFIGIGYMGGPIAERFSKPDFRWRPMTATARSRKSWFVTVAWWRGAFPRSPPVAMS